MKTYVNTSLIDAHNAQMQLEQIEGVRLKRAGTMELYGKFFLICAAGLALIMIAFGAMTWLMSPAPAVEGDEHLHTYDISEVVIHNGEHFASNAQLRGSPDRVVEVSTTVGPKQGGTISESLAQIQSGLASEEGVADGTTSQIERDVEESVSVARSLAVKKEIDESAVESSAVSASSAEAASEQTLPGDQFVVFRSHELDDDGAQVVTGLKYSPNELSTPFQQYCYWTDGPRKIGSTRFNLGEISPDRGLVWEENEMVERYKQFCQFLGA